MNKKTNNHIHRVIALLDRDQIDYLDELGKDALFLAGHKLSRTKIISYLIDFAKEVGFTGKNIKTEEDFWERISERMEANYEQV